MDQTGAVVGVASAVLGSKFMEATGIAPQNVNFAVHASILELLLRSRNLHYTTSGPSTGPLSTAVIQPGELISVEVGVAAAVPSESDV